MDRKRAILRILILGALDEALWGWLVRGVIVGGLASLRAYFLELPDVVIVLIGFWAFIGVIALLLLLKKAFGKSSNQKQAEQLVAQGISDFTQKYADWMTTAIQDDVRDLPSCILIGEPHIYWEHLEEREDAYIEFNFDFWSSSVHLLEISKQVQGHICFQGGELERAPEITQEASQLRHLGRSRVAHLKIRQWLSFPVKVRMKTQYGSQVEFDFSKVNISVVATLPDGSQGSTCRFPIPKIISAQMPNHPNAPVPETRDSQS